MGHGTAMSGDGGQPNEASASATISRRTALKAGVGAGVGLAAWSGPTITSLGGTPAYALGCTFAVEIDLIDCRNTDRGVSQCPGSDATHRFHKLKDTELPIGYAVINNLTDNGDRCCNNVSGGTNPTLQHPLGVTCTVELLFARPNNCSGPALTGYPADISLQIDPTNTEILLNGQCPPDVGPSTQYSLIARCSSTGSEGCF